MTNHAMIPIHLTGHWIDKHPGTGVCVTNTQEHFPLVPGWSD